MERNYFCKISLFTNVYLWKCKYRQMEFWVLHENSISCRQASSVSIAERWDWPFKFHTGPAFAHMLTDVVKWEAGGENNSASAGSILCNMLRHVRQTDSFYLCIKLWWFCIFSDFCFNSLSGIIIRMRHYIYV